MAPAKGAGASSMANTATGASAADIATNQALLFHAEAARLAKSWLRGPNIGDERDAADDDDDGDQDKADEEFEKEFLRNKDSYSETGGIGYHPPTESTPSTSTTPGLSDSATTTFLRKQLLRGHQQRGRATNGTANTHSATTGPRPQIQVSRRTKGGEEDSDEEESRSGVGKSKRKANNIRRPAVGISAATSAPLKDQAETGPLPEGSGAISAPTQSHGESDRAVHAPESSIPDLSQPKPSKKRGAGSYLDELLASRAAKKQKKKNKNKGKGLAESEPG
ncbi:hypothetical protein AYL99_05163 [Fonsecaea erecta]|uniref:Uncharacterized protein n=1 Tax=Fonsecaea erecta TaxID=1367422 RepID=A0A178ZL03_9EURO|nr:hypothetical protein AYL99_05163 [Fonsecaea erecta]OAP60161.1 hypothetical protein AYL99_05163 [Fonsecaea erecta]